MSNGGFFARMANLWTGFLNLWVSDIEKEHPEIAYENSINSMVEKYSQLKRATASIIRRREDISGRLGKQRTELAQVDVELQTAVDTNQDDLALILLQKKQALESEIAELDGEASQAAKDAEEAKTALMDVQTEINKLKAEKDRMLAKMASAKARIQIQDQLDGLSVAADVKALDGVREHIKNVDAQARLNKELKESNVDERLKKLRAQTGDVSARRQLEELKAKAAAAKAQTTKTL
ncbi:MAG: PspA/IM30 family protein [Deltaproteobacteria bacterium]|nr:PspA/IM30 family protein [Deltaproteobacteria bacterium]